MTDYQKEGKKRLFQRQEKRKDKWSERIRHYGRGSKICSYCNKNMTWCSVCQVWSSNCCIEYGTCQCS